MLKSVISSTFVPNLSVMSSDPSASKSICQFFARGKHCRFGTNCKFLHNSQDSQKEEQWNSKHPSQDLGDIDCKDSFANLDLKSHGQHEGSSSDQSRGQVKTCRFFARNGRCYYKDKCRFLHEGQSVSDNVNDAENADKENVSQHVSAGDNEKKPRSSATTNNANRQSGQRNRLCKFFKAGHCTMGDNCRFRHPEDLTGGKSRKEYKKVESKYNAPKIAVRPPTTHMVEDLTDEDIDQIRYTEIEQLKKRYPDSEENEDDNGLWEIQFIFKPTDPDWPYDVKSVPLMLRFSENYPSEMLGIHILEDDVIPNIVRRHLKQSINEYVVHRFQDFEREGKVEIAVKPLLRWLDRNLEDMFTFGLKLYQRQLVAKAAGLEFVSAAELQEELSQRNSGESNEDESSEEDSASEDEGLWEQQAPIADVAPNPNHAHTLDKRGTEVKLQNLQLIENLATLNPTKIMVVLQCERCKHQNEISTPVSQTNAVVCAKCAAQQLVTFRPAIAHQFDSVIGYLDMAGCIAFDLILPQCTFNVGCLECSKEMTLEGLATGQPKDAWCHHCHSKMRVATDAVKFLQLQQAPVETDKNVHQAEVKKIIRVLKDPAIQEGRPLPENGTCKHYKKSFRWLRFPCCGKAFPCDICHDDKEDHEYKFANRMICGHCCKEQPFAAERPCIACNSSLTKNRTSHWEGGKGCRDKTKMSRDDDKKYSNMNKTQSRKAKEKSSTGKKTTKKRT